LKYDKVENHAALVNTLVLKAEHLRIVRFIIAYYRAISAMIRGEKFDTCVESFKQLNIDASAIERLADVLERCTKQNYNVETLARYSACDALTRTELLYATIDAYHVLYNVVKASNVPYLSKNRAILRSDNMHMRNILLFVGIQVSNETQATNVSLSVQKSKRKANKKAVATIEKSLVLSSATQALTASN